MGFPNAKQDDQVDSTVFALAWSTPEGTAEGWITFVKTLAEREYGGQLSENKMIPVWLPPPSTTYELITGRWINSLPEDRIVEMTEEECLPLRNSGAKRLD